MFDMEFRGNNKTISLPRNVNLFLCFFFLLFQLTNSTKYKSNEQRLNINSINDDDISHRYNNLQFWYCGVAYGRDVNVCGSFHPIFIVVVVMAFAYVTTLCTLIVSIRCVNDSWSTFWIPNVVIFRIFLFVTNHSMYRRFCLFLLFENWDTKTVSDFFQLQNYSLLT